MLAIQAQETTVHAADSNLLTLKVVSASDNTVEVTSFEYLINEDDTGTNAQRTPADGCSPSSAGYPDSCKWTSMGISSSSRVVTQGDQSDFHGHVLYKGGLPAQLPAGRYLISVLAKGYKLDGQHFTLPMSGDVTVQMQPTDPNALPSATIQAAVFDDISPANGAPDLPAEHGLAGFRGQIGDYLGQVTTDILGNPLCTEYDSTGAPIVGSGGNCLSKCYVVDNGVDIGTVAPLKGNWGDGVVTGDCPNVSADLAPTDPTGLTMTNGQPVPATAQIEGKVKIPNVGPNRYALSVIQPDASGFIQTTTLEGNHDWDAWVMEGATGLDTEFVQGGEPFPAIIFGYLQPSCGVNGVTTGCENYTPAPLAGTATVKGTVDGVKVYYPPKGGSLTQIGQIFGGLQGAKIDKPIENPWISLTDLDHGDTVVWMGHGAADGTFSIPNVPTGNYTVTWWDDAQDYILDLQNIVVQPSDSTVDMGVLPLNGWWTVIDGYVYNDLNRNGIKDAGEAGIPNFTITMRKRENSLMDRGGTTVTTDSTGHYQIENGYPMTQWLVEEAYNDRFYTTGITYQADNQPTPTTITAERDATGAVTSTGVDVSVLPIIGLSGRLDWGVHTYDASGTTNGVDPRNGGIVGTVSYDTTRNELDPRYAAVEDWQPGIPGVRVNLYQPLACVVGGTTPCDSTGRYQLAADGSYAHAAQPVNTYVTEKWEQPTSGADGTDCQARDVDGNPLVHGTDEQSLPTAANSKCLEGPLMGVQFQHGFSAVDGNYGFTDGCFAAGASLFNSDGTPASAATFDPSDPHCATDGVTQTIAGVVSLAHEVAMTPLPGGKDYLVEPVIPKDAFGTDLYKQTREEDVNIANGDPFVPQVPPSACAGALHTVDLAGSGTDGYAAQTVGGITVPPSSPTTNDGFPAGGSPYEGQARPLCNMKLVTLNNGKSIVPTFNWFTDVPLPGRFWGLVVDDLNFSGDPKSLTYGEKAGVPFAPVGIYDYTNRLVYTAESDYNGLFDVLMPSTNRINCPTPSGVCANLYRFVGNDPGIPGRLNLNYKPQYRTIAAEFEALPGLIVPADLAPTQVGVTAQLPGGQVNQVACPVDAGQPQLFSVSKPYGTTGASFTIKGQGFGSAAGVVDLDGVALSLAANTVWSDTSITVTLPNSYNNLNAGPHQLNITAANGLKLTNGLTFHFLRTSGPQNQRYNPPIIEVGPNATNPRYRPANSLPATANHAIQNAIDDIANGGLVVVYPGLVDSNPRVNPRGAYFENLVITKPVTLQGVGSGGTYTGGSTEPGSIIDGSAYAGDSPVATDWQTRVAGLTWVGNGAINDGAVITLYAPRQNTFGANAKPTIDGFDIRGGDQQGFPTNLNVINGTPTGLPAGIVTQGGAIYANAFINSLQITNNVVQNNGGGYGTIRIGTPDLGTGENHNFDVNIARNRIVQNGGTNQAGAIGLFAESNNYTVQGNDICGNFSAEYGGGVSAVGLSPNGKIQKNRIWFNASYDEGGGVMIAGALPADPTKLSGGSGSVEISGNVIQSNLSNDDGGGIRFLMAGTQPMNVFNNVIANNVSTHEGGGVSLNDATDVRFYNNTVVKNLTTATAVTSNGDPAPAGFSTSLNSDLLQGTLPTGSPVFSKPLLFNNVFWDNRAGTRAGASVIGLGQAGDSSAINSWDLGVADAGGLLTPTNSVIQTLPAQHPYTDVTAGPTGNRHTDPLFVSTVNTGVAFQVWRNNPQFVGALLVVADLPPKPGDYHLVGSTSPAYGEGAGSTSGVNAPNADIDGDPRNNRIDAGADQVTRLRADLSVTKTDGTDLVAPGATVTYTVTVANAGPNAVTGASVTDQVLTNQNVANPAPRNFVAGSTSWTCLAASGSACPAASGAGLPVNQLVNLPVGGSVTFTVTGTVPTNISTGTIRNQATVTAPAGVQDNPNDNNVAVDRDTVANFADVSVTNDDAATSVKINTPTTYSVRVANNGAIAVNGATVTDNMAAIAYGSISWTCAVTVPGDTAGTTCPAATGTGALGAKTVDLAPHGAVTFTITATPLHVGSLANTATVALPANPGYTDPNLANNTSTDTDTITPYLADLTVAVAHAPVGPVELGTPFSWTVTVVNNGPDAMTGARVTDTLPAGFTAQGPWTCTAVNGATCPASSATLASALVTLPAPTGTADAPVKSSVTFTITGRAGATGAITDAATVTDPTAVDHAVDPNPADNVASDQATVTYSAPVPGLGTAGDAFNRNNGSNNNPLGANWFQNNGNIRITSNQATGNGNQGGQAMWSAGLPAGAQGASFLVTNLPNGNQAYVGMVLQASGGTNATPNRYIRVRYGNGGITVNTFAGGGGGNGTAQATFPVASSLVGKMLTAVVTGTGTVAVYADGVNLGAVALTGWTPGNAPVRIGIQLSNNARIDNFIGGSF